MTIIQKRDEAWMKIEEIRSLAQIMQDAGLTGLEIADGSLKVRLEKKQSVVMPVPFQAVPQASAVNGAPAAGSADHSAAKPEAESFREIKSPMVGVFYTSPSPESEPYVKVGTKIKKGDIICIIEAMKLLNEINSDQDGEIAEICVDNGQVVEYGQTLFKLR